MSSRSMLERALEHDGELRNKSLKSHALKHIVEHHPDLQMNEEGSPDLTTMFKWELHSSCRSSFEIVILDAVVIKLCRSSQGSITMNSR